MLLPGLDPYNQDPYIDNYLGQKTRNNENDDQEKNNNKYTILFRVIDEYQDNCYLEALEIKDKIDQISNDLNDLGSDETQAIFRLMKKQNRLFTKLGKKLSYILVNDELKEEKIE